MFDRLIDLISSWGNTLKFWVVISCYERGVLLRWGKYRRVLEPGLHFIWPFADDILTTTVVANTVRLKDQNLSTLDDQDMAVAGVITFKVADPAMYLLEVEGGVDAICDVTYGAIAEWVSANTRADVRNPANWSKIETKIRRAAKVYGIDVVRFMFADQVRSKAIRLLGMQ